MAEEARPRGRPSVYTPEIADEVLRRMSGGESLRSICREAHMPDESTVRGWVVDDREGFAPRYARARELQVEHWADEIIEISDDGSGDTWVDDDGVERVNHDHIKRSALRVDTRKWLMSKLVPKRYGEKVQAEVTTGEQPFKVYIGVDPDAV